ncbi:MAG: 2-amino-4-hydroxy-6-hydroxymethyldihydropteridine diphosphokinase [Rudaea sp.]
MATVYLALGTNLGDREQNLREAERRLGAAATITGRSSIYETEPWGVKDQPRFLNQVIRAETRLSPQELLSFLKAVEQQMGRAPSVRYGPRLIDLDILFYDDRVVHSPDLEVPHPRLAERRFVLVPLAELAPELVHPQLHATMPELLAALPADSSVHLYRHLQD